MRKLFVKEICGDLVRLTEAEHKHLSKVLRAKTGDDVIVCDESGSNYECVIERIARDETLLRVHKRCADIAEPDIECRLFFGVQKGTNNESTVRHAVELGASRLTPFLSEFTVAQDVRLERLNKIALEASKQCGRSKVPPVDNPVSFEQLLKQVQEFDLVVFLYEKAAVGIKEFLRSSFNENNNGANNHVDNDNARKSVKQVAVIIGAEGGFSEEEAESLIKQGVTPLSMGIRILKADTAAVTALSCVMYESGNL